jgi:hypothetical protein
MRIDSSGNVGIGTSSPGAALDITASGAQIHVYDSSTYVSGTSGGELLLQGLDSLSNARTHATIAGFSTGSNVGGLKFSVNNLGQQEVMRLDSSGNVGIGTDSPVQKLHVSGASGSARFSLERSSSNTTGGVGSIQWNALDGHAVAGIVAYGDGNDEGAHIAFNTTSAASSSDVYASTSERMRIDSSGNLLVGTTSGATNSAGIKLYNAGGTLASGNWVKTLTGTHNAIRFYHNGTNVGNIQYSDTATSYLTSSDYRLKENVEYDWDATTRLKQLRPSRFNFIADADTTVDGFLAHEVQDIVPEAISGVKDEMQEEEYEVTPAVLDDDGNVVTEAVMGTREVPKYQGIDQSKLVPLLVKTIQELEARITTLENA